MKCVCHIYSTWDVTLSEEIRHLSSERPRDLTRDTRLLGNRNRSPTLLPLLINQIPLLKQEVPTTDYSKIEMVHFRSGPSPESEILAKALDLIMVHTYLLWELAAADS